MRSALGKELRKRFEARLGEALPGFEPVQGAEIPSGHRLFAWQVGPNLTFFILLELHHLKDWFNLSLAWSEKNAWPSLPGWLDDPPREGEKSFRLRELWNRDRLEPWWELAPAPTFENLDLTSPPPPMGEALARIEPLVEDAIHHLLREGLDYMKKVAAEHGHPL